MLKRCLIFCFLLLYLNISFASTVVDSQEKASAWSITVAPYVTIPWMNGNTIIKNIYSDVKASPSDLKDTLDSSLELYLEANKNGWSLMLNPSYFRLKNTVENIELTSTQSIINFGLYRTLLYSPFGNNAFIGDAFIGGRYWYFDGTIEVLSSSDIPAVTRKKHWTDPVIGGRLVYMLGHKWTVVLHGDVGGFGVGSHFTWLVYTNVIRMFTKHIGLSFGLSVLGVNYGHAESFKYNVVQYGPTIGLNIAF